MSPLGLLAGAIPSLLVIVNRWPAAWGRPAIINMIDRGSLAETYWAGLPAHWWNICRADPFFHSTEVPMFVLVHHNVTDAESFWHRNQQALEDLPSELTLHHCLAAQDGTRATCLWEAPSVDAVRSLLEPLHSGVAVNEYRIAENREGIGIPAQFQIVSPPRA
jgi:hypothetical protein